METSSFKGDYGLAGNDKTALLTSKSNSSDGASRRNKLYLMIILVLGAIVITLGFLNLYQAGYLDGSSSDDSDASTDVVCNGHGSKYDDTNLCECIQCWSGPNCETESESCYISAGSGQPFLFLEFWDKMAANGEMEVYTPINYRVPYQTDTVYGGLIGPFREDQNSSFAQQLAQLIRRVHIKYGNVNMTNKHIVFGMGASQLQTASMVAYSKLKNEYPILLFDQLPYYFGYPTRCRGASSYHCEWYGGQEINESEIDRIVEIVTIPNNPDGWAPQRIYPEVDTYALDLVYYWPHFYQSNDEMEGMYDAPLSYFSFTKFTGHAASRFGWAVADPSVASAMRSEISANLLALSVDNFRRAWTIFSFIEERGDEYFGYIRDRLKERWDELLEILDDTNAYELEGRVGSQYAWLRCVNKTNSQCQSAIRAKNINPYWGTSFGIPSSQGYARFNLAEYEDTWQRIIKAFREVVDDEDF